ncbi:MAG: hypothetical protein JXC31_02285 [Acholeplasmataceae bacterium]|nr:hypothetical protein [Acholeplasmataceae bacterium]
MFTIRKLLLNDKMRLIMMAAFFIVFVYFSITLIIAESEWINRILIIAVVVFFSFFFILSEILKYLYKKVMQKLVADCDPEESLNMANKFKKYDIIKGYKNPLLVLQTLIYMDLGDYNQLEKHIENPVFQAGANMKLIYNYNKFYIALNHHDFDQATEYFRLINEAYKKKSKRKQAVKPIYSLNLISADYYLYKKNMTKAEDGLRAVNPDFLNPREKTYYYISYAKFCKQKGLQKEITYLKDAQAIGPHLAHVKNYD